jgi:hypothetical protein
VRGAEIYRGVLIVVFSVESRWRWRASEAALAWNWLVASTGLAQPSRVTKRDVAGPVGAGLSRPSRSRPSLVGQPTKLVRAVSVGAALTRPGSTSQGTKRSRDGRSRRGQPNASTELSRPTHFSLFSFLFLFLQLASTKGAAGACLSGRQPAGGRTACELEARWSQRARGCRRARRGRHAHAGRGQSRSRRNWPGTRRGRGGGTEACTRMSEVPLSAGAWARGGAEGVVREPAGSKGGAGQGVAWRRRCRHAKAARQMRRCRGARKVARTQMGHRGAVSARGGLARGWLGAAPGRRSW